MQTKLPVAEFSQENWMLPLGLLTIVHSLFSLTLIAKVASSLLYLSEYIIIRFMDTSQNLELTMQYMHLPWANYHVSKIWQPDYSIGYPTNDVSMT